MSCSVSHLRLFGCVAYAHVPKEKRGKLDECDTNMDGTLQDSTGLRIDSMNARVTHLGCFERR